MDNFKLFQDGMKINECGCKVPFFKDFSITPDMKTKMIVEKFILTFFTHYDCTPRKKTEKFYDPYAILTINTAYDGMNVITIIFSVPFLKGANVTRILNLCCHYFSELYLINHR